MAIITVLVFTLAVKPTINSFMDAVWLGEGRFGCRRGVYTELVEVLRSLSAAPNPPAPAQKEIGMRGGICCQSEQIKVRIHDLLNQNGTSLTFLPSEDVSQWPENLRWKMERGGRELINDLEFQEYY
jgi:hypothetical protein